MQANSFGKPVKSLTARTSISKLTRDPCLLATFEDSDQLGKSQFLFKIAPQYVNYLKDSINCIFNPYWQLAPSIKGVNRVRK